MIEKKDIQLLVTSVLVSSSLASFSANSTCDEYIETIEVTGCSSCYYRQDPDDIVYANPEWEPDYDLPDLEDPCEYGGCDDDNDTQTTPKEDPKSC